MEKLKRGSGAPKKGEGDKTNIPIHFATTLSDKEELKLMVEQTNLSQSDILRQALKLRINQFKTTGK